jgi:hypothetical protein
LLFLLALAGCATGVRPSCQTDAQMLSNTFDCYKYADNGGYAKAINRYWI